EEIQKDFEQDLEEDNSQEEDEGTDEEEKTNICLLAAPLIWKNKLEIRTVKGMPKSTYYRKFGTSSILANAARGTSKITSFFRSPTSASSMYSASLASSVTPMYSASLSSVTPIYPTITRFDNNEDISEDSDDSGSGNGSEDASVALEDIIAQLQKDLLNNEKTFTVFEYNERRVYEYFVWLYDGHGKMKVSKIIASIVYISPKPYKYKRICFLGEFYLRHECFPVSYRGQHQKCKRLIDDEDGIYFDGHGREDVVEYRKRFLEEIRTLERRIVRYEGSIMEPIPPVLGVGIWVHDEKMPLCKKGNGKSIMVSEFLLEVCESTNHLTFADNAIVMQRMNKGPGGKQSVMRLTTFINSNGQLIEQEMVFEKNYSDPNLRGKPKGIKRVGLQNTVPQVLDSVDIITIRKFARKSWRYMELYHKGLTGKLAE
ncbi:4906_t:CDS:2, partial [Cetraspora pellucida]